MDFLGSSQTFLGTLATLTILCVLFSESNFIHEILKDIMNGFKDEIKSMRMNTKFEEITDSSEYKSLCLYVNENHQNGSLNAEGIKLLSEITLAKQSIQFKYAPSEDEGQNLMGLIFDSKEQIMAPFYSFGYCIVFFVFDELLRITDSLGMQSYLCSSMVVFNVLSFLFWWNIWRKFYIVYRNAYRNNTKDMPRGVSHLDILKSLINILGSSLFAAFLFFISGLYKLLSFDADMFKFFMFTFIILNGFVVPFYLPYFFFHKIYMDAKEKVKNSSNEAKNEMRELMAKLKEFCKKINV